MTQIPPDFGGFLGFWSDGDAYLVRFGRGNPVESVRMTPLNALQARKLIDDLIEQGMREGHITKEHLQQARQMPSSAGLERIIPRDQVDKIAGSD